MNNNNNGNNNNKYIWKVVPRMGLDESEQHLVQAGEARTTLLSVEHKHQAARAEKAAWHRSGF